MLGVDGRDRGREPRGGRSAHHVRFRRDIDQSFGAGRRQAQHPLVGADRHAIASPVDAAGERLERRTLHRGRAEQALERRSCRALGVVAGHASAAACARQSRCQR